MIIPLYVILIVYAVFFALYLFFLGVNIYHLKATDTFTGPSVTVMVVVVLLSVVTVVMTVYLLWGTDWTAAVSLSGGSQNFGF
jgi:hypothetical protein